MLRTRRRTRPDTVHERLPDADAGMPVFTFDDVSVDLGGEHILREVDLGIPGSGITVILGASGSGKSTLTRLCNRLIDATSGRVALRGIDVQRLDVLALRRTVGMVFQRPTLFDGSVADNLAATGITDRDSHRDVLASVDLDAALLGRPSDTLSVGESQRLCLARSLLISPEVLVADEPTASLDETSKLTLERLARRLADRGVPILWVTHDLGQFDRIADHGVVLEQGRVRASGSAGELRDSGRLPASIGVDGSHR